MLFFIYGLLSLSQNLLERLTKMYLNYNKRISLDNWHLDVQIKHFNIVLMGGVSSALGCSL